MGKIACLLCYKNFLSMKGLGGQMRSHTEAERTLAAAPPARRQGDEADPSHGAPGEDGAGEEGEEGRPRPSPQPGSLCCAARFAGDEAAR